VPEELTLSFSQTAAKNNLVQWHIDGSPMIIDFLRPTLQNVVDGNTTFNVAQNVYHVGEIHKWQYWVIQQANGTPPIEHPIHLHGHDFYILDSAANTQWAGDISRLKTDNPIRRDTATLPAGGYLVLAFESDNPGAWLVCPIPILSSLPRFVLTVLKMHCHIPFHISAGLGVQFVERQGEILNSIGSLDNFENGCKSWATFQNEVYPDGFGFGESGL
jgi:hypothetical protein